MTLQALLVSKDDNAAEALSRVLAGFAVAVERSSDFQVAGERVAEQKFDAVIVDFDDPEAATRILQSARQLASGANPVSVALISDESKVRTTFGAGANFVLTKPVSVEPATATLRAATALLKHERRRSFRVSLQTAVQLSLPAGQEIEGIMLDLSETGMDVLSAQPLYPSATVGFRFSLPDGSMQIEARGEVAWANPNGQSGVRFLDLAEPLQAALQNWLLAHSPEPPPEEAAPTHCKLTDLSLGGCYVETDSPFPEQASVDLCLKAEEMEVHAEGLVRIMHPTSGMGIAFPSRTSEQREKVGEFIQFLTSRPGTVPALLITPRSLHADEADFSAPADASLQAADPLLELLCSGHQLNRDEFLAELRKQRNSEEEVASS